LPPRGLYIEYQLLSFGGKNMKRGRKRENEKEKGRRGKEKGREKKR
jgi:hypothetical protein